MTQPISLLPASSAQRFNNRPFAIWKGRLVSLPLKQNFAQWIDKIAHLFEKFFAWLKDLCSTESLAIKTRIQKASPRVLPPADLQFLKAEDPAYNLERLSTVSTENALQSVCTQTVYEMVPQVKAHSLGYDDPSDYQTALGDRAIAIQTTLTALTILGISRGAILTCLLEQSQRNFQAAYGICQNYAADFWQKTAGTFLLGGSASLLGLSLFAHRKGWLGSLLYDRSLNERQKQIASLFYDAAKELITLAQINPEKAKTQAEQILANLELIEGTLRIELQLPKAKARAIVEHLESAAKTALVPPLFVPPPVPQSPPPNSESAVSLAPKEGESKLNQPMGEKV